MIKFILVTAVLHVRLCIEVTTLLEYLNLAVYNSKGMWSCYFVIVSKPSLYLKPSASFVVECK